MAPHGSWGVCVCVCARVCVPPPSSSPLWESGCLSRARTPGTGGSSFEAWGWSVLVLGFLFDSCFFLDIIRSLAGSAVRISVSLSAQESLYLAEKMV